MISLVAGGETRPADWRVRWYKGRYLYPYDSFFKHWSVFLDPSQGQNLKSYGIEVQHVTTDDHGEWQVRTTNEDEEISSTGTFYVTVAKEPKDIKILCLNKVTSNMEECDDQVTHFNASFSICLKYSLVKQKFYE